jgi:outer membrane protein assembly factor BamB
MRFLIKAPGAWTWETLITDSLAAEVEKGRVRPDWLVRLEGESGESTVAQLLEALATGDQGKAPRDVQPAATEDLIVLGMSGRVATISKTDGHIIWSTELNSSLGSNFVTLLIEGNRIFASCAGHLHCLDLGTGEILWTNELPGYGYHLASLCLPGGKSSPDPAVQEFADEAARRASH